MTAPRPVPTADTAAEQHRLPTTSPKAGAPGTPPGFCALLPHAPDLTPGERAAAQMLSMRDVVLPAPVVQAAAELVASLLDHSPDRITREAIDAVLARLYTAVHAGPVDHL